jgi:hypothetical protein
MSLSMAETREERMTAGVVRIPMLSAVGGGSRGGLPYAQWRPEIETAMMRAGLAARDYRVEIPDWTTLEETVEKEVAEREQEGLAQLLGKKSAGSSSSKAASASKAAQPGTADEQEKSNRQLALDLIGRVRKAYGLLYAGIPGELRLLLKDVPQGYAYGLWIALEKRFLSTDLANVAEVWEQFTSLVQGPEESFEEYKARVDDVKALLAHAKDPPSEELYAHRLLWKLQPRYDQAVMALKAGDKLANKKKIDWAGIVVFMRDQEMGQRRLMEDETSGAERSMVAQSRSDNRGGYTNQHSGHGRHGSAGVKCYGCGGLGHYKSNCPQTRREHSGGEKQSQSWGMRDRRDRDRDRDRSDDSNDEDEGRKPRQKQREQAQAARATASREADENLSSDYSSDEGEEFRRQKGRGGAVYPACRSYSAVVYEHTGNQEDEEQEAGSQEKACSAKMMMKQGRPGPDAGRAPAPIQGWAQKKMMITRLNWPCRAKTDGGGTETTELIGMQRNCTRNEQRSPDKKRWNRKDREGRQPSSMEAEAVCWKWVNVDEQ